MPILFLDCTSDMLGLWKQALRPGDPAIDVNVADGPVADPAALLAGHDICIVDHSYFDADMLARCTSLRHIVYLGTGASSFIDVAAAARLNIKVHTIKGYGDTTVAEHTMALAFAAARGVARMDRDVRAGQWRQVEGMQLFGKTLGIVGMGGIGRELARIAAGLGMRVAAWNRTPLGDSPVKLSPLDQVLAEADILCVTLALTEHTRGFIDAAKLSLTKPGVIVVNTARAAVIDQGALVDALRSGHVRHAAVDVFMQEPPAADDPLLSMDNVTLTAHAGFNTPEATLRMLRISIELATAAIG